MKIRQKPRRLFRPRSPATVDQAVALACRGRNSAGRSTLYIGSRVGQVAFVPPNYEIANCDECGSALWVSADVVRASEARGMRFVAVCFACGLGPDTGDDRP